MSVNSVLNLVFFVVFLVWQATLAELRSMLQLVEADTRQVYISVVNPLLSARLAGMLEHGDFTAQVGSCFLLLFTVRSQTL